MYRFLGNRRILLCGLFSGVEIQEVDFEKYKEARGLYIEDPIERVKSIFMKDSFGGFHPELASAIHMGQIGMLTGIIIGGFVQTREDAEKYIRLNETTTYKNKKEAHRLFFNNNMWAAIKGAFKWAPRFGLLFGSYSFISSCCELYRNKIGLIDNIVAGSTIGAIYRFMYGIKGMISGAFFGGLFGTAYGTIMLCMQKIGNYDQLQLKYAHFAFIKHKEELKKKQASGKEDKEISDIVKSGLHVLHIPDPLDALKDGEEKGKKNQT